MWQTVSNAIYLGVESRSFDHKQTHMCVVENELVIFLTDSRIDRQQNSPRLLHTEIDIIPFRSAGGNQSDILALCNSQMHKSIADQIAFFNIFVDEVVFPFTIFFILENRAFRTLSTTPFEQIE